MSTTITIRTDEALRESLARRAEAQGKTISQVVREILENALVDRPLNARVGHLKGKLGLPRKTPDSLRRRIKQRNWRS